MAFHSSLWGLFLILVNLFANEATGLQDQQLVQPQDFVSVVIGESLKLVCQVAADLLPGPVKWFLGNGPNRKLIYTDKSRKELKRVTRHQESSDTDFTIILHNVTPEDAGMYYCVKQKREHKADNDWISGHGTQVVVKVSNSDGYIIPTVVCALLAVLLAAAVAIYFYIRKKRGRNRCTSRSETFLPESTKPPNQLPGDKEIVYADLKDPKGLQRAEPSIPVERSEYATVRIAQTVSRPCTKERKDVSLS